MPRYDWGSDTGFDRRHILNISYIYALPWFTKSEPFAARAILGGWSISGITFFEKGLPLFVRYTGPDTLGPGRRQPTVPTRWARSAIPRRSDQPAGSAPVPLLIQWLPGNGGPNQGFGNAGKDSVVGPGIQNWNLSLFKTIPLLAEGPRIELRFESFNTFNHTSPRAST